MNKLNSTNYDIDLSDGIITFKKLILQLVFVRYNEATEIKYIFINPIFRRKGLAKKLLQIVKKNKN